MISTVIIISAFVFPSVPSDLITSASLSPSNPTRTVGSSVILTCRAMLSVDVSGAMIKFDYQLGSTSVGTGSSTASSTTEADTTTISPVSLSTAGDYTCIVTVTASGVCGGGGSEPTCPTKTSNTATLTVQCEC